MSIIIFDTETTGLIQPELVPLSSQPYLLEIYAVKGEMIDGKFDVQDEFFSMVRPPIAVPKEATAINGITDSDLIQEPTFPEIANQLARFFWQNKTVVAHNLAFDLDVLFYELKRIDWLKRFPWSPVHHCTVELARPIEHRYLKLINLYEMATGEPLGQKHRARDDVEALIVCYEWLHSEGWV